VSRKRQRAHKASAWGATPRCPIAERAGQPDYFVAACAVKAVAASSRQAVTRTGLFMGFLLYSVDFG
jgi:hypothetical protein